MNNLRLTPSTPQHLTGSGNDFMFPPVALSNALAAIRSALNADGTIDYKSAPSPALQSSFEARRLQIGNALSAVDTQSARQSIAKMLAVMPMAAGSGADAAAVMEIYIEAVAPVPGWAVKAVSNKFIAGKIGQGRWAPTPAEFRRACDDDTVRLQIEARDLDRVINAERVGTAKEAERARVAALVDDCLKSLASVGRPTPTSPIMTPEQRLEATIEHNRENPVQLSDALLAKMRGGR